MRPIQIKCSYAGCTKIATEEVFNTHNAPQGKYCRRHGSVRVAELKAGERLLACGWPTEERGDGR